MASPVEEIKSRLDIAEVVSSYVSLTNAGGNFKTRCPFHNERTPSFFVSPARQTYHCFGCDRGGDMFSFVEEIEGVDFAGALKILAEKAGVELRPVDPQKRTERDQLFAVLEEATRFFETHIKTHPEAQEYLSGRGVTKHTITAFRLGVAPSGWEGLVTALKEKGFSENVIERAGLAIKSPKGGVYDRFRGRIMFPLSDASGRIVGFSGRILPSQEASGKGADMAKYINTPETEVYDKSKVLYGFAEAKMAMRTAGLCILVEGQMDMVMSHQAGVNNAVAVSGTALTRDHIKLIKRLTDKIAFAFDGDAAGLAAAQRGLDIALEEGVEVRVIALPEGKDPADIIAADPKEWEGTIEHSLHVVEFFLDSVVQSETDTRLRRKKVGELVLPYVARIKSKMEQAHFVSEIARKLDISEDPIWEELAGSSRTTQATPRNTDTHTVSASISRRQRIGEQLMGIILWQSEAEKPSLDVEDIKKRIGKIIGDDVEKRIASFNSERRKELVLKTEISYDQSTHLTQEVEELLTYLQEAVLKEMFADTMRQLKQAETEGDEARMNELLTKCQELSKQLSGINKS